MLDRPVLPPAGSVVARMTDDRSPQSRRVSPSSDELFRLMVESATDFAILAIDRTGTVTSWNIGAEHLLGFAEDEIVGRDGDVVFTPEDRLFGAPEKERALALANGRAEDERWHVR